MGPLQPWNSPRLVCTVPNPGLTASGKWPIPGFVKTGDMVRVEFRLGVLMFQVSQISFPAARLCKVDELKNVGKSSEMKSLVGDGIGQRLVARKLQ